MNYLYTGKDPKHNYYYPGRTYPLVIKQTWPFRRIKVADPGITFGKSKPVINYKSFAAFKDEWKRVKEVNDGQDRLA